MALENHSRPTRILPLLALLLTFAPCHAQPNPPTLEIQIANKQVQAGGVTQIELRASQPNLISQASLQIDLDPAFFAEILDVTAFSAAGDAIGVAEIDGLSLKARFTSPTGGIGRLPDLPILTITATVKANLPLGAQTSLTATRDDNAVWKDPFGTPYAVSVIPATLTVGGSLWLENVTPGGVSAPAGTLITITGAGFDPEAIVEAPGLSLASIEIISPQQISLTLEAPAEMTGKRITVQNPDGAQADYVSSLRRIPDGQTQSPHFPGVWPLIPLRTQTAAALGYPPMGLSFRSFALENPNAAPVDVTFEVFPLAGNIPKTSFTRSLPSSGFLFRDLGELPSAESLGRIIIEASAPIRVVVVARGRSSLGQPPPPFEIAPPPPEGFPIRSVRVNPTSISFNWQTGAPLPIPRVVSITAIHTSGVETEFRVEASTESGGEWLSVSPDRGVRDELVSVAVNPSMLSPGIYLGAVTVTPIDSLLQPASVSVTLTVSASPFLRTSRSRIDFGTAAAGATQPLIATVDVETSGGPAEFTAAADATSGGNWLSASPSRGTAPAQLSLRADSSSLAPGNYSGTIIVASADGVAAPEILEASLAVVSAGTILASRTGMTFSDIDPGMLYPAVQQIELTSIGPPVEFSVTTDTGLEDDWLVVSPREGMTPATLTVTTDPATLAYDDYFGAILIAGPANSASVSVHYWAAGPLQLRVVPEQLSFVALEGAPPPPAQSLEVFSVESASAEAATESGGDWLQAESEGAVIRVQATPLGLPPGRFRGRVTVKSADRPDAPPARIPVSLFVLDAGTRFSVDPPSLRFEGASGTLYSPQELHVDFGGAPTAFSIQTSGPFSVFIPEGAERVTPLTLRVRPKEGQVLASELLAGPYHGETVISTADQSVRVPLELTVIAGGGIPPC